MLVDRTMNQKFSSREIHAWRMAASVFWSIVFQFLFLLAYIFLIQVDIFHPYSSITNWFEIVTSFSVWLNIFPLTIIIFAQGIVCSKGYINGPLHCKTRFAMLRSIFSFRNVVMGSLHIFIGTAIALIYTSFSGDDLNSFNTICKREGNQTFAYHCFSEKRFFLVLGGFWIGLYYFISNYDFGSRSLIFPLIQQLKFIQVKTTFFQSIKQAMWDAIFPSILFLVMYYFRGGYVRSWFCNFLSTNMTSEPLDSILGLLNISVILYLWLFSSIFVVTLRQMEMLFNIHLTEYSVFPTTSLHSQNGYISLKEALGMSSVPIIQHLAFLDLFVLSEKDQRRREEIFSISQPGGHPHTWNGVLEECLKIILTFTKDLETISIEPVQNDISKPKNLSADIGLKHSHVYYSKNVRSLSATSVYDFSNDLPRTNFQQQFDELGKTIKDWINEKRSAFLKKSFVLYFVGELPERKLRFLLYQSQPIIWASQSLSLLVCASLTEDNYGVVQNNLNDIILALLKLKQALEKVPKQITSVKKSQGVESFDVQMRIALKSAVKRSIYKIAITFRDYIKEIGLTVEAQQQMLGFIACREV